MNFKVNTKTIFTEDGEVCIARNTLLSVIKSNVNELMYVCRWCSSGLHCKGLWYQMRRRRRRLALTWKQPKSGFARKTRSSTRSSTVVKSRRNIGWDQPYHDIFYRPGSCHVYIAPPWIKRLLWITLFIVFSSRFSDWSNIEGAEGNGQSKIHSGPVAGALAGSGKSK